MSNMPEKSKIVSLEERQNIQTGRKKLLEEIRESTGYETGVFIVSDKTGQKGTPDHICTAKGCGVSAKVYESRIIAVIDPSSEKEIEINMLPGKIREILGSANSSIHLCMNHLLDAIGNGSLEDAAKPIITASMK
jgi:hypothetical protein